MYEAPLSGHAAALRYDIRAEVAQVVAEPGPARIAACEAASRAGFRLREVVGAAQALADISILDGVQLLLIEGDGIGDDVLEPLLLRLGTLAEDRRLPVIATLSPEQIDLAASLLPAHAALQCAPSEADRVGAVIFARPAASTRLSDIVAEDDILRMRRFQEEVARIADSLARLTRGAAGAPSAGLRHEAPPIRPDAAAEITAPEIRRVIRARRLRSDFFQGDLFADPAWDMLLDLLAAELEGRKVPVSSLCIAAAVPPTTALRWIGTLNEAGLFQRQADPKDRRRAYIGLSAKARNGMLEYMAAIRRAGLPLV